MAISDFLSNGTVPQGSAVKSITSTTALPDWYTNTAMDLLGKQQALLNKPYQTYQAPRVAGFTPDQQAAFGQTRSASTSYQPGLTAAQRTVNATSGMPTGMSAALPFAQTASGNVADPSAYMDPYVNGVVDRVAELGNRNLTENIMPGLEGRYIGAGQLGFGPREGFGTPSGMMTDTARAIRDTQDNITAQQGQLLSQGWANAQNAMGSDLNRSANMASTMAGIANSDATQNLNIGNTQATLAGLAQQYGLTGANAMSGIGQTQQGLNQQNLDVAYQDFLAQRDYKQNQLNNSLNTFKGVATGIPQTQTEQGIVPNGDTSQPASTGSTIASGLAGAAGLLSLIKGI